MSGTSSSPNTEMDFGALGFPSPSNVWGEIMVLFEVGKMTLIS